jgi:putative hydrolase of the HAD superfamily
MQVCKPNAEIYTKTLKMGGFKPEETLFVDDSITNIKAAEAVGIHGLHVNANEDWLAPLIEKLKTL